MCVFFDQSQSLSNEFIFSSKWRSITPLLDLICSFSCDLCVNTVIGQEWIEFASHSTWVCSTSWCFTRECSPLWAVINDSRQLHKSTTLAYQSAFNMVCHKHCSLTLVTPVYWMLSLNFLNSFILFFFLLLFSFQFQWSHWSSKIIWVCLVGFELVWVNIWCLRCSCGFSVSWNLEWLLVIKVLLIMWWWW